MSEEYPDAILPEEYLGLPPLSLEEKEKKEREFNLWAEKVKVLLENVARREAHRPPFLLHIYSADILKVFEDTRKKTISFRNFRRGKEWPEVQRYFKTLLHLATDRVVDLEEVSDEHGDDILITLLPKPENGESNPPDDNGEGHS